MLTSTACSSGPSVVPVAAEPELIEIETTRYVLPPDRCFELCPISGLPLPADTTWLDLPAVIKLKHLEQKACNERIRECRAWVDAAKAMQGD